ncbi:hypothetical protein MRB53_017228 [Persea americana]|uniref:Uncharacterized protein n=1 Tax=Persea americana TaxID=3435 RepID=A0ACC2M4J4_PERAE|nr:hypothetical protein MRB53_017228 [Persea americana]
MTQRQEQGSFSVSEDLQENVHTSFSTSQSEKWILVMQDVLWVASIAFIVYMGDWNSNLIHVLWKDERIKRTELYLGLLCTLLNVVLILFITTPFLRDVRRADEESEILTASSAPTIIILGLLSFFWLSVALWPIWSFFTLPLLITLFRAPLVTLPYLSIRRFHPEVKTYNRTD